MLEFPDSLKSNVTAHCGLSMRRSSINSPFLHISRYFSAVVHIFTGNLQLCCFMDSFSDVGQLRGTEFVKRISTCSLSLTTISEDSDFTKQTQQCYNAKTKEMKMKSLFLQYNWTYCYACKIWRTCVLVNSVSRCSILDGDRTRHLQESLYNC